MNSTNAPHMIEYATKSLDFTPHDTKWISGSARIVCCGISPGSKGAIRIYELEREGTKELLHDNSFRSVSVHMESNVSRLVQVRRDSIILQWVTTLARFQFVIWNVA